jgi:RND family efflux transporter MFP subunit
MYAMASPIYVVQQITPVKILVGISETDYTRVKKGDVVSITADALPGRTFEGKVNRLYPTIDPATHTFKAEVVVPNTDRVLRPGMYARVTVNFGTRRSVIVPDKALVKQEGTGTRFIYVLRADNTVGYLPVTVGRHMGQEYEVLSGLEEGARVVVKGQALLRDGVKVNVL